MAKHLRVISLVVLLLAGGTSLMALPDHEVYFDYYTDATFSTWCGYKYVLCTGIYRSGCQTAYYTVEDGPDC